MLSLPFAIFDLDSTDPQQTADRVADQLLEYKNLLMSYKLSTDKVEYIAATVRQQALFQASLLQHSQEVRAEVALLNDLSFTVVVRLKQSGDSDHHKVTKDLVN